MGLYTPRNVCMACGRYWILESTPSNPTGKPKYCPYCGDNYYCDNVIAEVPLPLGNYKVDCVCGATFAVETADAKHCVICMREFKLEGSTQADYQEKLLTELGLQ